MFLELTDGQFASALIFMAFCGLPTLIVIYDKVLDAVNAKDKNAADVTVRQV